MQMELTYSIRTHLEDKLGIPSIYMFDGVTLPREKPFTNVKQMQNNHAQIAKLRESMQTTFRFQVGLFASNNFEMTQMQGQIRDSFMFDDIPLYTELGELTPSFFNTEIMSEVPITPEDLSDKTSFHRIYFDVQVVRVFHKNKGAI